MTKEEIEKGITTLMNAQEYLFNNDPENLEGQIIVVRAMIRLAKLDGVEHGMDLSELEIVESTMASLLELQKMFK